MKKLKENFTNILLVLTFLGVMWIKCYTYMAKHRAMKVQKMERSVMKKMEGARRQIEQREDRGRMQQRMDRLRQSDGWSKSKRERVGPSLEESGKKRK